MAHSDPSYLVPGTLIDQQRILHEIELVIVTKKRSGQKGVQDEAISEMKLARTSPVPDGGPYALRYVFKGKQYENQVRLKLGSLIST